MASIRGVDFALPSAIDDVGDEARSRDEQTRCNGVAPIGFQFEGRTTNKIRAHRSRSRSEHDDGDADASDLVGNEEVTIKLSGSNKVVLHVLSNPPVTESDQLVVIETQGQIANSLDDEQIDKIELAGQNNRRAKSSFSTLAKKTKKHMMFVKDRGKPQVTIRGHRRCGSGPVVKARWKQPEAR